MKKIILLFAFTISTLSVNAQEFRVGISGALPVGDAGDISSFGVNAEFTYLWALGEQLDIGINTGYIHYFTDDFDYFYGSVDPEDISFLPVALAGRFYATSNLVLGADLGYGIVINPSGNDGGLYYAPKALYAVTPSLDVVLSYKSVELNNISFSAVTLGFEIGL